MNDHIYGKGGNTKVWEKLNNKKLLLLGENPYRPSLEEIQKTKEMQERMRQEAEKECQKKK